MLSSTSWLSPRTNGNSLSFVTGERINSGLTKRLPSRRCPPALKKIEPTFISAWGGWKHWRQRPSLRNPRPILSSNWALQLLRQHHFQSYPSFNPYHTSPPTSPIDQAKHSPKGSPPPKRKLRHGTWSASSQHTKAKRFDHRRNICFPTLDLFRQWQLPFQVEETILPPIYENESQQITTIYRPVSLISFSSKPFGRILKLLLFPAHKKTSYFIHTSTAST